MNTQDKKRMTFICVFIIAITVLSKIFSDIPFQVVFCNLVVLLFGSEIIRAKYVNNKAKWAIIIPITAVNLLFAYVTSGVSDLVIYTCICDVLVLLFGLVKLVFKREV